MFFFSRISSPLPRWVTSLTIMAALTLMFSACTDDVDTGGEARQSECPPGEELHPILEECVEEDDGSADTGNDPDEEDTGSSDNGTDPDEDTGTTPEDDTGTTPEEDTGNGGGPPDSGGGPEPEPCEGLQCETADCPAGEETTISGTVNIPSGELPLPDIMVYVPNSDLDPVADGAVCQTCDDELSAEVAMGDRTDVDGTFVIEPAPVGEEIPLVVETGKWRREHTIEVEACQDNPIDPDLTRLPRNRSEGSMPQIAVTTGHCDALECLMRKIGIDDDEISTADGDGIVHLYVGDDAPPDDDGNEVGGGSDRFDGGDDFIDADELWTDADKMLDYDIMLSSCECTVNSRPSEAYPAFQEFVDAGGRAFLSHYHYDWLNGTSDFDSLGTFGGLGFPPNLLGAATGEINQSFPKGEMLADWMFGLGISPYGEFDIYEVRGSIGGINDSLVQDWVMVDGSGSMMGGDDSIQYISFNTPVGIDEEDQCGRVVFSDIHVAGRSMTSSIDRSTPEHPFPTGCVTDDLSEQEKALIFMLFDLSSCIIPDDKGKGEPF